MKSRFKRFILLLLSMSCVASYAQQITFIPNKGQFETPVIYKAQIPGGVLFVEKNCLTYYLLDSKPFRIYHDTRKPDLKVQCHVFKVWFDGCNESITTKEEQPTSEYYNYYIGKDPSKWATGLYGSHKITLRNIYNNIDLEVYSTQGQFLKYNFIVHEGGNIAAIKLRYEGIEGLNLKHGNLQIPTSLGVMQEEAPIVLQNNKSLTSKFVLSENVITFNIKSYDKTQDVIIDPKVVFSTFSGSISDNWGFTGTYDNSGNGYSGGTVYGFSYPTTTGAFEQHFSGGVDANGMAGDLARDAGILKYSSDGKRLLFCTYLGGSNNEQPHSMVVNSKEELLILGTTMSADFPMTSGGYDITENGLSDIYVVKLSKDGKQLLASTFIGGSKNDGLNGNIDKGLENNPNPLCYNYGDLYRGEINIDGNDNVYFTSCTESDKTDGFPILNGFQQNFGGVQDGCVFKMNSSLSFIYWSSYIGGGAYDAAYALCLDRGINLYVVGGTNSANFNFSVNGNKKKHTGGVADGYILKINNINGSLLNATYVGTPTFDETYFVQADSIGNIYVAGQTDGSFPIIPSTIYNVPNTNQFIQVYSNDLNTLKRSTSFGRGRNVRMALSAFLVDKCNHVFLSGWGGEVNSSREGGPGGGVFGLPLTGDAYQKTSDGSDFYIVIFSKDLNAILYATYFGGDSILEHVDGGTSRFDREGIIYQSVCGGCGGQSQFPTTPGAWSRTNNSDNCNNALFKIDFENLNRSPIVEDSTYTIYLMDTLSFSYQTIDPDVGDSIYTTFGTATSLSGKTLNAVQGVQTIAGIGSTLANFKFTPTNCNLKNDSFYIKVFTRDVGCPGIKTDTATIKIKILPPPLPDPPKIVCMTFVDEHTLKIRWDSFAFNKFIKYFLLYKTDSKGTRVMDTFRLGGVPEFIDADGFDYTTKNYCFRLIGVNVCNEAGKPSYDVCSLREYSSPIDSTYIFTATVVDNKNIKVVWLKSKELDFESYMLYRKQNNSVKGQAFTLYKIIKNIEDTFYTDDNVDVQNIEYCYNIKVSDYCSHISKFTNQGCNIVLHGNAVPFEHDLNWSNYKDWYKNVNRYELFRYDDRKFVSNETTTPPNLRDYVDKNLDYDWGGYWYYVLAHQNPNDSNYLATSQSNTIYLYQPPLLWVPNAFSSNNDGLNDTWGIVPVFVKEYDMKVYNRWGQIVFESKDKKNDWNGDYKGRTPFDEVLVWIVTYTGWDNRVYYKKGNIDNS